MIRTSTELFHLCYSHNSHIKLFSKDLSWSVRIIQAILMHQKFSHRVWATTAAVCLGVTYACAYFVKWSVTIRILTFLLSSAFPPRVRKSKWTSSIRYETSIGHISYFSWGCLNLIPSITGVNMGAHIICYFRSKESFLVRILKSFPFPDDHCHHDMLRLLWKQSS